MKRLASVAGTLSLCCAFSWVAHAGDPDGVIAAIRGLSPSWPEASFSIDVTGTSNGQAILDQPVEIEYEAALPGYVTYLRVSSHGDMTLSRTPAAPAEANGLVQFTAQAPLGDEQVVVLFSSAPLDFLFTGNESSHAVGSDRDSATALVQRLNHLDPGNIKVVARRYHYEVATAPGGTEYTTRGITFRVLGDASEQGGGGSEHSACANVRGLQSGKGTSIPAHIGFEFNSDQLTAQGRLDLDVFGAALNGDLRDRSVILQGNTDAIGGDDYNMALSGRRAMTVRRYLEDSFAIASSRITTVGMGKSNPIAPNDSDADRACNRRVDFIISRPSSEH